MSLKTRINGNLVNLTAIGKKPYTFINGVKTYLKRGYTFINGQKVILWNFGDVKIETFNISSNLTTLSTQSGIFPVFANGNKVILSTSIHSGSDPIPYNVITLNASDFSNLSVANSVRWGKVFQYSSIDSTNSNMVFYAGDSVNNVQNVININPNSGEVTVGNSASYSDMGTDGTVARFGDGTWLTMGQQKGSATCYLQVRANGAVKYAVYGWRGNSGTSLKGALTSWPFTKLDGSNLIGWRNESGTTSSEHLTIYGVSSYTDVIDSVGAVYDILVDGDYIIFASLYQGIYKYNKSWGRIAVYSGHVASGRWIRLLGKIGKYYYAISTRYSTGATAPTDGNSYLLILDESLNLFNEIDITAQYDGVKSYLDVSGYYGNMKQLETLPQISKSGYLVFTTCNIKSVRSGVPTYSNYQVHRVQGY